MNEGIEILDKIFHNVVTGAAILSIIGIMGPILIVVVFLLLVKKLNSANNKSPRIAVPATIVAKRTHMSGHHHSHGIEGMHHRHSTYYYVTFQMDTGDRMELRVPRNEIGLLVEGDHGMLTFQGSQYLSFERY